MSQLIHVANATHPKVWIDNNVLYVGFQNPPSKTAQPYVLMVSIPRANTVQLRTNAIQEMIKSQGQMEFAYKYITQVICSGRLEMGDELFRPPEKGKNNSTRLPMGILRQNKDTRDLRIYYKKVGEDDDASGTPIPWSDIQAIQSPIRRWDDSGVLVGKYKDAVSLASKDATTYLKLLEKLHLGGPVELTFFQRHIRLTRCEKTVAAGIERVSLWPPPGEIILRSGMLFENPPEKTVMACDNFRWGNMADLFSSIGMKWVDSDALLHVKTELQKLCNLSRVPYRA